jgi:DNA polymerase epsilon subunit 1
VGLKQTYVKLTFLTTHDLTKVRKDLLSAVRRNKERQKTSTAYADMLAESIQVKHVVQVLTIWIPGPGQLY